MGIAISVKYSEFHLKEQAALGALRAGLEDWFQRYNEWCPYAALGKLAPGAY
jgi:transposase InsO family protein